MSFLWPWAKSKPKNAETEKTGNLNVTNDMLKILGMTRNEYFAQKEAAKATKMMEASDKAVREATEKAMKEVKKAMKASNAVTAAFRPKNTFSNAELMAELDSYMTNQKTRRRCRNSRRTRRQHRR